EVHNGMWTLLIQGIAEDDKANPGDAAYYLAAAVEAQLAKLTAMKPGRPVPLYPDDHLLGGLVTGIEIAPPLVRPPEKEVSSTAYFFLPLLVGVAVAPGQPYTSP